MTVSNGSAPLTEGPSPHQQPDHGADTPAIRSTPDENPPESRAFLLGLLGIALLLIGGVVGQVYGLRSIQRYSELRGRLVSVETEHARISEEINTRNASLAKVRAKEAKATSDLQHISAKLTQTRETERLSDESAKQAQKEFARADAARQTAIAEKEVANTAHLQLADESQSLRSQIDQLTNKRDNLQESVNVLSVSQANYDSIIKQLRDRQRTLKNLGDTVDQKKQERDTLLQQLAELKESFTQLQKRKDALGEVSGEIGVLQESRDNLQKSKNTLTLEIDELVDKRRDIGSELKSEEERLEEAQEKRNRATAERKAAEESLTVVNASITSLKSEEQALQTKIESLADRENIVRTNVTELTSQLNEERNHLAEVSGKVQSKKDTLEAIRQDTQDAESDRATAVTANNRLSKLLERISARKMELRGLQEQVADLRSEEEGRLSTLEKILRTIDAAWNVAEKPIENTATVDDDSTDAPEAE